MKKLVLSVAAIAALTLPALASAQSTVTAKATVAALVSLTGGDQTIALGELSDAGVTVAPGGSGSAVFTLGYNTNATVAFTNVATALTNGGASIPATFNCGYSDGGSYTVAPCAGLTWGAGVFDFSGNAALSRSISVGIEIGGLTVSALPAGTYSGTLTITASTRT